MHLFSNNSASAANHLHHVAGRVEVERSHLEQSQTHFGATATTSTTQHNHHENPHVSRAHIMQPKSIPDKDLPHIPSDELKTHNGQDGNKLFIVVDDIVLDVTSYVDKHPGGKEIIKGFAGQNCTWQWWSFHNRGIWENVASNLRVGRTDGVENAHVKPQSFVGLRKFGYQDDEW